VTKHIPVYKLTVRHSDRNGVWNQSEISAPFSRWFDSDGHFIAQPFQLWLRSEVSLVNQADPRGDQDLRVTDQDGPEGDEAPRSVIEELRTRAGEKTGRDTTTSKARKFKK
jgi:hypothetical protein